MGFLKPNYRDPIEKNRSANSPRLTWRYTRFGSFCHPGKSIMTNYDRLWQILPVKAPHFKYFAILLITLCCMTVYSRKNSWFQQQSSSYKKFCFCKHKWLAHKMSLILWWKLQKHTTIKTNIDIKCKKDCSFVTWSIFFI